MVGKTIGQYYITSKINEGGLGVIYKATDTRLDREVVIKTVTDRLAKDAKALARIEEEAKFAAKINSPFVCRVFDYIKSDENLPIMVMELVGGTTLSHATKRDEETKLMLCADLAEGLQAVHAAQIVHRDLKPHNVMVTWAGRVVVMDFGLACKLETQPTVKSLPLGDLTDETLKNVAGSKGYQSPEQLQRVPIDHRSDIFAFGIILAELLLGRHPFKKDTDVARANAVLRDAPDLKGLPADTTALLKRLLGKATGDRYQSMLEVRNDISKIRLARFLTKTVGESKI